MKEQKLKEKIYIFKKINGIRYLSEDIHNALIEKIKELKVKRMNRYIISLMLIALIGMLVSLIGAYVFIFYNFGLVLIVLDIIGFFLLLTCLFLTLDLSKELSK